MGEHGRRGLLLFRTSDKRDRDDLLHGGACGKHIYVSAVLPIFVEEDKNQTVLGEISAGWSIFGYLPQHKGKR